MPYHIIEITIISFLFKSYISFILALLALFCLNNISGGGGNFFGLIELGCGWRKFSDEGVGR